LVQKCSRIKIYHALAVPILLYGSKILTLTKKKLTSRGMKFFRRIAGYTLFDPKRNEERLEELRVESADRN
jgi:hypothetical protein